MTYEAETPKEYIEQLPKERQEAIQKLRTVIKNNLPKGFKEGILYKMIGYFVPLSTYPNGYHCQPGTPLHFINIASQKNSVNLYHSGIYSNPELLNWFVAEYPKHCKRKLDMGKSCIRFKKMEEIPFDLIGELCSKITVDEWITMYENALKK